MCAMMSRTFGSSSTTKISSLRWFSAISLAPIWVRLRPALPPIEQIAGAQGDSTGLGSPPDVVPNQRTDHDSLPPRVHQCLCERGSTQMLHHVTSICYKSEFTRRRLRLEIGLRALSPPAT